MPIRGEPANQHSTPSLRAVHLLGSNVSTQAIIVATGAIPRAFRYMQRPFRNMYIKRASMATSLPPHHYNTPAATSRMPQSRAHPNKQILLCAALPNADGNTLHLVAKPWPRLWSIGLPGVADSMPVLVQGLLLLEESCTKLCNVQFSLLPLPRISFYPLLPVY